MDLDDMNRAEELARLRRETDEAMEAARKALEDAGGTE